MYNNDESLGQFCPDTAPYDPESFFAKWLQACFAGGKRPDNFYSIGFFTAVISKRDPLDPWFCDMRAIMREWVFSAHPILYVYEKERFAAGSVDLFDVGQWYFEKG